MPITPTPLRPAEPGLAARTGDGAESAAEAGADGRLRMVRREVERVRGDLGQQTELARLELAIRNLESTWLFLERGDASLVAERAPPSVPTDVQMRIVEAQEAERSRLAQEVHDGPAQALSNAIFQVEYIERVIDTDLRAARTPSCASCATCSAASWATSAPSSASSGRRSSMSSASTARSPTRSPG